jgi:Ala-tRNA(Pro) deacylase
VIIDPVPLPACRYATESQVSLKPALIVRTGAQTGYMPPAPREYHPRHRPRSPRNPAPKDIAMTDAPEMTQFLAHGGSPRERLFHLFATLGIDAPVSPYPVHSTVEEGKALRGAMAGTFTKNLLLRDKKDRLFLLSIHEDRTLDLKTLHQHIGASGRLGFAPAERMRAILDVEPGALTPLALPNEADRLVSLVIDASLLTAEQVNFHPLVNTESVGLRPADLLAFAAACGREPILVDFDRPTPPTA